jgi:hypothetical protein
VKRQESRARSHPAALEDDCRFADIVIAPFTIGKRCRAARVIIHRRRLQAEGPMRFTSSALSIRAESVAEARGRRPWVPDRAVVETVLSPPAQGNDAADTDQRSAISDQAAIQKNKDQ